MVYFPFLYVPAVNEMNRFGLKSLKISPKARGMLRSTPQLMAWCLLQGCCAPGKPGDFFPWKSHRKIREVDFYPWNLQKSWFTLSFISFEISQALFFRLCDWLLANGKWGWSPSASRYPPPPKKKLIWVTIANRVGLELSRPTQI